MFRSRCGRCSIVTLRQGLKPHGFFCHSSVREKRRNAAWLRLGASRSGGGIAEGASPSRRILSWAVPGPVALPCLSERERWPTTSVSGVLGTAHTRAFRRCSPGNVPQRRRLFPMLLFALPHAPSAVQPMVPCLRRSREQSTAVQHGRVFTGSPSLPNPYTMQLERDYMPLLFVCVISGNSRANTSTRLTPWVLHHRGLRRAEAPFCQGPVQLLTFCEELRPNARKKRRLQRRMDRQRRANNPQNYDEKGRVKKGRLTWKNSRKYLSTRRELANAERRLAAHRKSLHGHLVNDLLRVGNTIRLEKTSFRGWQKVFGKSVARSAPGMFSTHLKRVVAKTGGTLSEVSTYQTKLSQYCHGCQTYTKKPLSQRWHSCSCGVGPVQRDLYSAFLLAFFKSADTPPSIAQQDWEGAEPRLLTAVECLKQRANEGHALLRSFGIPGAGARQSKSLVDPQQERSSSLLLYRKGRFEALEERQEPPVFEAGEVSLAMARYN